jgi:hypothetical protein
MSCPCLSSPLPDPGKKKPPSIHINSMFGVEHPLNMSNHTTTYDICQKPGEKKSQKLVGLIFMGTPDVNPYVN